MIAAKTTTFLDAFMYEFPLHPVDAPYSIFGAQHVNQKCERSVRCVAYHRQFSDVLVEGHLFYLAELIDDLRKRRLQLREDLTVPFVRRPRERRQRPRN